MRGQLSPPPAGWLYLIALGSNRRHPRHGDPRRVLAAVLAALAATGRIVAASHVIASSPLGPSRRRYANATALLETHLAPPGLLARLKQVESSFGRRPGRRWGARVVDLDIILWQGGRWRGGRGRHWLAIPHPQYHLRDFVLVPAVRIAPHWRDPHSGLKPAHLLARARRVRPVAANPPERLDRRRPAP